MNSYELDQPLDLRLKALNLSRAFHHELPSTASPACLVHQHRFIPAHHGPSNARPAHFCDIKTSSSTSISSIGASPLPNSVGGATSCSSSSSFPSSHISNSVSTSASSSSSMSGSNLSRSSTSCLSDTNYTCLSSSSPLAASQHATAPISTPDCGRRHQQQQQQQHHNHNHHHHHQRNINQSPNSSPGGNETSAVESAAPIMRQHSLVSRYNCKPCGIVFSQPETLRAHQEGYCTKTNRAQLRSQSAVSPAAFQQTPALNNQSTNCK